MANMSYCRFSNTVTDLQDCFDHMWTDGGDDPELSVEEAKARKRLIQLARDIAAEFPEYEDEDEDD
jgi:hypothetical protein